MPGHSKPVFFSEDNPRYMVGVKQGK